MPETGPRNTPVERVKTLEEEEWNDHGMPAAQVGPNQRAAEPQRPDIRDAKHAPENAYFGRQVTAAEQMIELVELGHCDVRSKRVDRRRNEKVQRKKRVHETKGAQGGSGNAAVYLSSKAGAVGCGSCHTVVVLALLFACAAPPLSHTTAEVIPVDFDEDGVADFRDCDDADPLVGAASEWWPDHDEDGFGDETRGQIQCPADNDWIAVGGDCDDNDSGVNPGIREVCDGRDHDCSGVPNDPLWYIDADADGFGVAGEAIVSCDWIAGRSPWNTDCDDTTWQLSPGMPEVCDDFGVDENCNGLVNDADDPAITSGLRAWYADDDRDTFGWRNEWVAACAQPVGYSPAWDDCDDDDPAIHPGASEQWYDGVDQDCNRWNDFDQDVDGYSLDLDCDDTDPAVRPTALERCDDGKDNDCDGLERAGCTDDGVERLSIAGGTVSSSTTSAWSGADLSTGDVDGDGLSDAIIGATGGGTTREGGLYVAAGSIRGDWALETDTWRLAGETADAQFGSAVTVADIDGDGWLDVVGGGAGTPLVGGALYAAFGPITGNVDLDTSSEARRLDGEVAEGRSWQTLVNAGDIDGDGAEDLLAGAVGITTGGPTALWLIHGDSGRQLTLGQASAVTSPDGSFLSTSASGGADLDGDGILDMVIGVPERGGGVVYVVSGLALEGCDLDDADIVIEADGRDASFGIAVSAGGDADGDGRSELLVGAASYKHGAGVGGAFLFRELGPTVHSQNDADATFLGRNRMDAAGAVLDGRGDLNGDSLTDIVLGAPMVAIHADQEGAVYVVLSPVTGTVDLTQADGTLIGNNAGNRAGSALDASGDFDGDGTNDLLIGAPSVATSQTLAGQTYVMYGGE